MKNKKGSTIVWAVMLIMVLMVIVGASLSFAYMSYNQSIKNRNKTQVELIANSAIKSLVSVIEDGKIEVPNDTTPKQIKSMELVNTYSNEKNTSYGSISDIYIKRKDENGRLALAYLTAHYANEDYTIYGYLVYTRNAWKCVQYDTDGNRNIDIKTSGSDDNTGGNTGDNTGGNTNLSSSVIDRMKVNFATMINAYYGNNKNDTLFNQWLNNECQNKDVNSYGYDVYFNGENIYYHPYNEIYARLYNNSSLEKLDDTIIEKAKNINNSISNDIYLHFLIIPNSNGKYCIVGNTNSNYEDDGNISLIIYNDRFYVKKYGNENNYKWKVNNGENGVKDLINSNEWQEIN